MKYLLKNPKTLLFIFLSLIMISSCNNEELYDSQFREQVIEEEPPGEGEETPEPEAEIFQIELENDTLVTKENVSAEIRAFDNDTSIPAIFTVSNTNPQNGTLEILDSGTPDDFTDDVILYTPNQDYFGTDIFEYTICDAASETENCATATVNITVEEVIEVEDDIASELKAFPGAEGYGKNAVGGRGGRIIKVTNLSNSGPGSFREACESSGPRIVVFDVGGRIDLSSTVVVNDPFITISGQTAPGDGITLTAEGTPNIPVMRISTNDVIMRYITIRRSSVDVTESNSDGLVITNAHDVIVDHCSFSWASDENIAIYDYDGNNQTNTYNITLQNCLIDTAYGGQDKGVICAGGVNFLSFYNLLFTDVGQRQPLIKNETGNYTTEAGYFEIINTVTFEGKLHTDFRNDVRQAGTMHLNYINNMCIDSSFDRNQVYVTATQPISMYLRGNISPLRTSISSPVDWDEEWSITQFGGGSGDVQNNPAPISYRATTPFNTPLIQDGVVFADAVDVFDNIKSHVGASLPTRDSEDARAISDVENRRSTAPTLSATYPSLDSGTPQTDSDGDGIPDAWEDAYGLDKESSSDAILDKDGDGYTNIEEYINSIGS